MSSKRKDEILEQAMELIIENGLGDLSMSKVARRMQFSEPAMYRHFENKQDLVICLIERVSSCFESLFENYDQSEPPEIFFPKYFNGLLRYLEKVKGVTILFLSESAFNRDQITRDALQKMFQGQINRIAGYIKKSSARGEITSTIDPAAAALVFLGTVQAITTRYLLSSQKIGTLESSQPALEIFLKGVVG